MRRKASPTLPPLGSPWRRSAARGRVQLLMITAVVSLRGVLVIGSSCDAALLACSGPCNAAEFLASVANPSVYVKLLRPPCGNSTHQGPTLVEVQFKLMSVNDVDEKLGHVTLNGHFQTWWKDPRLAFNGIADGGCLDAVDLRGDLGEDTIWTPDLYIDNVVRLEESGAKLTSISPEGVVWRSWQILVTVMADFDLSLLPYDRHTVDLVVASYSQPATRLRMIPRGGKLGEVVTGFGLVAPNLRSKVWALSGSEMPDTYATAGRVRTTDEPWDYVHLRLELERKPRYYIDQAVYPVAVLAMISYSQFWVDSDSAPARATLAVIPVLIMRTMCSFVYGSVPQGSQHMLLSDFLFMVNLMVAIAAVEFAMVQYLCQVEQHRAAKLRGLSSARSVVGHLFLEAEANGMSFLDFLNCRRMLELPVCVCWQWANGGVRLCWSALAGGRAARARRPGGARARVCVAVGRITRGARSACAHGRLAQVVKIDLTFGRHLFQFSPLGRIQGI